MLSRSLAHTLRVIQPTGTHVDVSMIGLAEAAQRLGLPYQDTHRLLLIGRLRGEKRGSRWYVFLGDVERLAKERAAAASASAVGDAPR